VLACKTTSDPALRFLLASTIMGFLSSLAKLLEYKTISHELQLVIGAPMRIVFHYGRKILFEAAKCIRNHKRSWQGMDDAELEAKLTWLHPKWILKISNLARDDPSMNVMRNFAKVLEKHWTNERTDEVTDEETSTKIKRFLISVCEFILAVLWTSVIEWVPPISELFLYAHNWSLSAFNVTVIVLSEFADIDRMAELAFLLSAYPDLFSGKVGSLIAKPVFWMIGYCGVMPLTLWWAYIYYQHYVDDGGRSPKGCETVECAIDYHGDLQLKLGDVGTIGRNVSALSAVSAGSGDDEMLPPMERTTTPFLMDSSRTLGSHTSKDGWDRFNFDHHNSPEVENGTNGAVHEHPIDFEMSQVNPQGVTGLEMRTSTMESTAI